MIMMVYARKKIASPANSANGSKVDDSVDRRDGCAVFWNKDRLKYVEHKRIPLPQIIAAKEWKPKKGEEKRHKFHTFNEELKKYCKIKQDDIKETLTVDELSANPADKITIRKGDKFKNIEPDFDEVRGVFVKDISNIFGPEDAFLVAKQVAMHVVFKTIDGNKELGSEIDVVTGHFKSGKKPEDVCVKPMHIDALIKKLNEIKTKNNPLIFAADFNTNRETAAFKKFEKEMIGKDKLLQSSYPLGVNDMFTASKWRRGGGQPSKCHLVEETIDFIFHNSGPNGFKTVGTLSVPHSDVVKKSSPLRLPCWRYPSDHFMIGADLVLEKKK